MTEVPATPVSIRGLSCGYGDRTALMELDLELPQGRTACLLGPGGAGKSTLLRILAERVPTEEDFWMKGETVRPEFGTIAYLGQRVLEEARSLLGLVCDRGLTRELAEERVLETWRDIPAARQLMVSVLDLPLRRLPVALRRFVAFTSMLAEPPDFILLDEPDAEMGDELRAWVQTALQQIRGRCTMVLTTHHLRLARSISDDCILLDSGQLVEHGPTEELFSNPRNERTRRFVEMGN